MIDMSSVTFVNDIAHVPSTLLPYGSYPYPPQNIFPDYIFPSYNNASGYTFFFDNTYSYEFSPTPGFSIRISFQKLPFLSIQIPPLQY